jgi:hypothetical protein
MAGLLDLWEQGRPYREALGGLLYGDVEPAKGLLGVGNPWPKHIDNEAMKQQAYQLAMDWNNPIGLIGMIRTPLGRIPESTKEIDAFADQLRRLGENAGNIVDVGSSNLSNSRYVTFRNHQGADYQVRLSNHGDRYPNQLSGAGDRFSVDPESRNTFEMAKDWLKSKGVKLSNKPALQAPPEFVRRNPAYLEVYPEAFMKLRKLGFSPSDPYFNNMLGTEIGSLLDKSR